ASFWSVFNYKARRFADCPTISDRADAVASWGAASSAPIANSAFAPIYRKENTHEHPRRKIHRSFFHAQHVRQWPSLCFQARAMLRRGRKGGKHKEGSLGGFSGGCGGGVLG